MGSVISVPMTAAAKIVGALVFVNEIGSRAFDAHDLEIAAEVARRAAIAIENARIADERARMADALQRELLPPSLPRMPGWEMATMYEPAGEINEVGGDFYEAFPVEGGWAVVLGDVSGKGAAAAAVTAEARHTIRTAGTLAADPVAGLHLLDAALRGRDDVALCSVALVVLPDSSEAQVEAFVYLAGHPHPILLRNGGAEAGRRAGAAARGRRRPGLDPDAGHARARRPARALHRRRDRGAAGGQRPLRQRPPPGAAGRLPGAGAGRRAGAGRALGVRRPGA